MRTLWSSGTPMSSLQPRNQLSVEAKTPVATTLSNTIWKCRSEIRLWPSLFDCWSLSYRRPTPFFGWMVHLIAQVSSWRTVFRALATSHQSEDRTRGTPSSWRYLWIRQTVLGHWDRRWRSKREAENSLWVQWVQACLSNLAVWRRRDQQAISKSTGSRDWALPGGITSSSTSGPTTEGAINVSITR